jgi:spore maturation protein CgeB
MPVPVDETMFYPLERNQPQADRFTVDVSFVKHGHPDAETMLEEFFRNEQDKHVKDPVLRERLEKVFREMLSFLHRDLEKRCYEEDMLKHVKSFLTDFSPQELHEYIEWAVHYFYLLIYSSAWRGQFLEAMDQAGIEVALYGNDWPRHPRLGHLARGPVHREKELNYVYNFTRINLHLSQAGTMHARLSECGMAGGFIMVSDHPQDKDWGPARPYFEEGKEVVFFDSKKDLVDKCRYYLTHEDERLKIARNMHERALRERTCVASARMVLNLWRELLNNKKGI